MKRNPWILIGWVFLALIVLNLAANLVGLPMRES